MIRAPGFWWDTPGAMAALLSPFATIYGSIAARRLTQPGERIGIPVICVGNPTVGGAGKTPAAVAIAKMLIGAGEKPYFLTRGYGGRLAGPVIVEEAHTAVQVGDEPVLLARIAPTVVASNRVAGARLAKEKGASIIVMDDGFQNPSLAKDLSILVIDGRRGLGNGRVLPAGPLRAAIEAQVDRAQAILVVGDGAGASSLEDDARRRGLPVFKARLDPDPTAVASLAGMRVLAFAGIGDPDKFFLTLAAAGIDAPVRRGFSDHHRFTPKEANALLRDAARDKLMPLTTEKDLARIRSDTYLAGLAERAKALPVSLTVTEHSDLEKLILGVRRR